MKMTIEVEDYNKNIFNKRRILRNIDEIDYDYERIIANKKECDHPMFAVVGRINHSNGGIYNEVKCVLCDKELKKDDRIEKNKVMVSLYKNKRLLAKYIGLASIDKLPMFDYISTYTKDYNYPVGKLRDEYFNYCDEAQELKENGQLSSDFSVEDSFFDSKCISDYNKYLDDKGLLEKEKVKTK